MVAMYTQFWRRRTYSNGSFQKTLNRSGRRQGRTEGVLNETSLAHEV